MTRVTFGVSALSFVCYANRIPMKLLLLNRSTPSSETNCQYEQSLNLTHTPIKTLGVEWNDELDHFHLTVADFSPQDNWTKCALSSDIAKTFNALGWFAPVIVRAKFLLQHLWEEGLGWSHPSWSKSGWNGEFACMWTNVVIAYMASKLA